jgi:hypothetical protein
VAGGSSSPSSPLPLAQVVGARLQTRRQLEQLAVLQVPAP